MDAGYVRVSADDQNVDRQVSKMVELGIDERRIFIEKASGKDFERPVYQGMKSIGLREGDVLYIDSIDRLGRNYEEIKNEWADLTRRLKVDIVVLDMPLLDTRNSKDLTGTLISDIVLQLLGYVAENERNKIRTRQAEGIAKAKERGVYKGRKPMEIDKALFERLYGEVKRKERTAKYAMQQLGVKRNTWYVLCEEFETRTGRFE